MPAPFHYNLLMPVFQYQCGSCSSIFEHLVLSEGRDVSCLSCASSLVYRANGTYFYPNKTFCPHDKALDVPNLPGQLSGIMSDSSLSCAGCGVDGAAGRCTSGGCGGGGCGAGSCGGACSKL